MRSAAHEPWSPSTNGPVTAQAMFLDVKTAEDLDKYKGKVTGKIVLYGEMRSETRRQAAVPPHG